MLLSVTVPSHRTSVVEGGVCWVRGPWGILGQASICAWTWHSSLPVNPWELHSQPGTFSNVLSTVVRYIQKESRVHSFPESSGLPGLGCSSKS